jgi:hypothetical protein
MPKSNSKPLGPKRNKMVYRGFCLVDLETLFCEAVPLQLRVFLFNLLIHRRAFEIGIYPRMA